MGHVERSREPAEGPPDLRLRQTDRALRTLRACTDVLLTAGSAEAILERACGALIEAGGYLLAWIGKVEPDEARSVRPIAQAGTTAYLDGLHVSWADDAWGHGPSGTAVRSGMASYINAVEHDPRYAPWRERASRCGFRAAIAVPFMMGDARAILNLYAGERDAFGREEVALLSEVGALLGYGLSAELARAQERATSEALRRSEARLLEAQRIARLGTWELELGSGEARWCGEVFRLFGYGPGEVRESFSELMARVVPEDRGAVLDAFAEVIGGDAPTTEVTCRIMPPDGVERVVHNCGQLISDAEGRPLRVVGTVQDITELTRAEAEIARQEAELAAARELERAKSAFVNAVTHELRSPITALKGYAELLEEGSEALSPERQAYLQRLFQQIRRVSHLVDDMLDVAQLDAGTFRLQLAEMDLAGCLTEVMAAFEPQAADGGITLRRETPSSVVPIVGDARRLDMVLTNLLANALKFTPKGGTVSVRLIPAAEHVRVEVADSGPGIDPADLPRIFRRFGQLEAGARKGGTGLGLSIAKALVEAHGGRIGLDSAAGKGATFWFTLPRRPGEADQQA